MEKSAPRQGLLAIITELHFTSPAINVSAHCRKAKNDYYAEADHQHGMRKPPRFFPCVQRINPQLVRLFPKLQRFDRVRLGLGLFFQVPMRSSAVCVILSYFPLVNVYQPPQIREVFRYCPPCRERDAVVQCTRFRDT